MKKASTVLVPVLLLGLSAAAIQSCASGETDPAVANGSASAAAVSWKIEPRVSVPK